jgi:hypothetical protein
MPRPRIRCCLLYATLLLATTPGCLSFHSYRPVPILVCDAETKRPIPGAEVNIWYPFGSRFAPPQDSFGVSDGEGIARLRAAPHSDAGIMVAAKAKGYLSEERNVATDTIERIEPEHWFKKDEQRPVSIVVEMYAEPRPAVELTIPTGYRGIVRVKSHLQDDAVWPPGQRIFPCTVDSSGTAEAQLPPLLRRCYPLDYRAKYTNGTMLSRDASPQDIGLHWLRSGVGEEIFVVGTKSDYEYMRSLSHSAGNDGRSGDGGGKDQGGGRRHRRGNQNQAPSD